MTEVTRPEGWPISNNIGDPTAANRRRAPDTAERSSEFP